MAEQAAGASAAGVTNESGGGRAGASDSRSVADVMSTQLVTVASNATVVEAARLMRDHDVGPVLVMDGDRLYGIVTDRDITIRVVAEDRAPDRTPLTEIASRDVVMLTPDDTVEDAIRLMRQRAVRRLPVVENGRPVGIVSLGDLAVGRDPDSALADISAAEPNQ